MPDADTALLEEAARAAGDVALRFWRRAPEHWDKGGGLGPVSEADLAVNRLLEGELRAARPDYGWLSEETEDDADRLSAERVFVIDPIDGTRAFLEGQKSFCHSLAVVERGEPVAAVVHLPAMGRTFTATRGGGAFCNGEPVHPSWRAGLEGATILAARRMLDPQFWPRGVPPVRRSFRPSLAYRLCTVASGRFDGMLTLRPTWEWDIAAGDLICREAGAAVATPAGGPPRYNSREARLPGLIAATPAVASDLLERLKG